MKEPRLLLDENIGGAVGARLRSEGFDVVSVREDSVGAPDGSILARSVREKRVVVTLDKDFGRLVFHDSHKHVGVIFLRLERESQEIVALVLLSVLEHYGSVLRGKFVVATEADVRMRE